MSRILFDQNCPRPLARHLVTHTVHTAADEGWSELANGALLTAAERGQFDVLLTADKRLRYQQRLSGRRIALVVLSDPSWPVVQENIPAVVDAIDRAALGTYEEVVFARPTLRRRPFTPP